MTLPLLGVLGGDERQYRPLVEDFTTWSQLTHLQVNTSKTKEILLDFRTHCPSPLSVNFCGEEIEVVASYKYLGLQLDNKLGCSANTDHVHEKVQRRLYFLSRLSSFTVCRTMLLMFYESVVSGALFFGAMVLCVWGEGRSTKLKDTQRLDKLINKATSAIGAEQNSVAERRILNKLLSIMDNSNPLHDLVMGQRSLFFLPMAIRLFNTTLGRVGDE